MTRVLAPGLLFIAAGLLHFARPQMYERIVPAWVGHAHEVVLLSGAAEFAGGVGLLIPATRVPAAWGLVVLLLAVWPANVQMALDAERYAKLAPAWALWARVPLQVPLIAWVLWAMRG